MRIKIILLAFLITSFLDIYAADPLRVRVEVKESSGVTYPAKVTVTNISKSNFTFWIMSCSYDDSFAFNSSDIIIESWSCDKNFLTEYELKPNQDFVFKFTFRILNYKAIKYVKNLKLRFMYYPKGHVFGQRGKRNVIWCEKPIHCNW